MLAPFCQALGPNAVVVLMTTAFMGALIGGDVVLAVPSRSIHTYIYICIYICMYRYIYMYVNILCQR